MEENILENVTFPFCKSSIVAELSKNTTFVEFLTPCLVFVVLPFILLIFCLICLLFLVFYSWVNRGPNLALTKVLASKLALSFAVYVISGAKLISVFVAEDDPTINDSEARIWSICSVFCGFALFLAEVIRWRNGIFTSIFLHFSWLLKLICSLIDLIFVNNAIQPKFGTFILVGVETMLTAFLLFLHCFADRFPRSFNNFDSEKEVCPDQKSSSINRLFYCYAGKLMKRGYSENLEYDSCWALEKRNQPDHLMARFRSNYPSAEVRSNNKVVPWLFTTLLKSTWFFTSGGMILAWLVATLFMIDPFLLKMVVDAVESDYPAWFCCGLVVVVGFTSLCAFCVATRCDFYGLMTYINVRSILMNAVYVKALKLSSASRNKYSAGEIINLITTDVERIRNFWFILQEYIYVPVMIIYCMIGLEFVIGHNMFYGLAVLILFTPINALLVQRASSCETKQMTFKDSRMKLMTDILAGIKIIKLYAWEKPMRKRVAQIRFQEAVQFRNAKIVYALLEGTFGLCPFLAVVASFTGFVLIDKRKLTPQIAFISLLLFNLMRFSIYRISGLVREAINTRVSLLRLQEYFCQPEIMPIQNNLEVDDEDVVLQMDNLSFSYSEIQNSKEETLCQLKNVSLKVKSGELIGIIGRVGAGKSSLLASVVGEMNLVDGKFYLAQKSVAYVPQETWIQNLTLKDNIIFGKPVNEEFYKKTIDCCALREDLKTFPAGDTTEIGERGLNLSGGQKARVALARAVYQDADLYLLDDTLSAVDSHVGAHIFQNVIGNEGLLKDKTRLFALNSINFLPQCDKIAVMKDGEITDFGTYEELCSRNNSTFYELLKELRIKQQEEEENVEDATLVEEMDDVLLELIGSPTNRELQVHRRTRTTSDEMLIGRQISVSSTHSNSSHPIMCRSTSHLANAKLVEDEELATGKVNSKMYLDYIKACGVGLCVTYFFTMFLVQTVLEGTSKIWLSKWTTEMASNFTQSNPVIDLGIYAGFGFSSFIFLALATTMVAVGSYRASKKLHDGLLFSLLRSPMTFFDTTPMGRILNRLSNDIEKIDDDVPGKMSFTCVLAAEVVMNVGSAVFVSPILAAFIVPTLLIFVFIVRYYTFTAVQIRRLHSKAWSKVTSHVQDSYVGATSIRAYGVTNRFEQKMMDSGMVASECRQIEVISNRWIQLRMDILTAIISSCFTGSAIYLGLNGIIPIGAVALIASTGTTIRGLLGEIARNVKDLEQSIVAVERVQEYVDNEHEAEWDSLASPRPTWPEKGEVKFSDFSLKYRQNSPLVLKHLNLTVFPGQKVGIVGRTGAGKTSLTMALFRIVEPATGTIFIDDVDFRSLGLHDLRKALTIIPQDPVLFCGSLRSNLDPFDEFDDSTLWNSIEKAHLSQFVEQFPEKLNHEISEGGSNLSVGQRQLVCLARAILRRQTKILVLDEATAAVDVETDQLIQQSIRTEFRNCTILTIAHRLNTILDYDKVLVMDSGEIREFDSPKKLLENKQSLFYGLAVQAKLI